MSAQGLTSKTQKGVALVFVLMFIALLSIMAAGFSAGMRNDAALVSNLKNGIQAKAISNAGIAYAKYMLTAPQIKSRWKADGRPYTINFEGQKLAIIIQDEAGKFDINSIKVEQLEYILEQLLEDNQLSQKLAHSIVDWRDADDVEQEHGAEISENYTPANRPFKNLRELIQVQGITENIYQQLKPCFTVQTHQQKIGLSVAPEYILKLLPGSTPNWVQSVLMARESDSVSTGSLIIPQSMESYVSSASSISGQYYSVRVKSDNSGQGLYSESVMLSRNIRGFYPVFSKTE